MHKYAYSMHFYLSERFVWFSASREIVGCSKVCILLAICLDVCTAYPDITSLIIAIIFQDICK